MRSLIRSFDAKATELVRLAPQWMDPVYRFVTTIFHPASIIVVMAAICVWAYTTNKLRLAIASASVIGIIGFNTILKFTFQRDRPATEYADAMMLQTFSFPSGHAAASAVGFGFLAYLAWKLLPGPYGIILAALCALIIFLVGASRVYLGAHYPSDVIAGWLVGIVGLVAIILIVKPI